MNGANAKQGAIQNAIDSGFVNVNGHLVSMEAAVNALGTTAGNINSGVAGVRADVQALGSSLTAIKTANEATKAAVDAVKSSTDAVGTKVDAVGTAVASAEAAITASKNLLAGKADALKAAVDAVKASSDDVKAAVQANTVSVEGVKTQVVGTTAAIDNAKASLLSALSNLQTVTAGVTSELLDVQAVLNSEGVSTRLSIASVGSDVRNVGALIGSEGTATRTLLSANAAQAHADAALLAQYAMEGRETVQLGFDATGVKLDGLGGKIDTAKNQAASDSLALKTAVQAVEQAVHKNTSTNAGGIGQAHDDSLNHQAKTDNTTNYIGDVKRSVDNLTNFFKKYPVSGDHDFAADAAEGEAVGESHVVEMKARSASLAAAAGSIVAPSSSGTGWVVPLGVISVDVDPRHQAELAAVAPWIRNLFEWALHIGFAWMFYSVFMRHVVAAGTIHGTQGVEREDSGCGDGD